MYKVEKGVAIQAIQKRVSEAAIRHTKYPFSEMKEVGDSFFVPNDGVGVAVLQRRIAAAAFQTGDKYCTQQVVDDKGKELGVRAWKGTRKEVEEYYANLNLRRGRTRKSA